MAKNDEEVRLDKRPEADNEPLMPGDNTVKPSAAPSMDEGVKNADSSNLTQNKEPGLDSAPDFNGEEA